MKKNYPTHLITHHSNGGAGNPCMSTKHHDVFIIDNSHRNRWPGFTSKVMRRPDNGEFWHVGYHLVTDLNTGKTTKTRAFTEEGAHCIGKNTSSIGWLFIGNYTGCSPDRIDDEIAKKEFMVRAPQILKQFNIPIENVVPHRQFASKDCHGSQLPDDYFRKFLTEEKQAQKTKPRTYDEMQDVREKVALLESLVQQLQLLYVQLLNRLTRKRLAAREKNNAKPAV